MLYVLLLKMIGASHSRCDSACFLRGVADWLIQSAEAFMFCFIVRAIRIASKFILFVSLLLDPSTSLGMTGERFMLYV